MKDLDKVRLIKDRAEYKKQGVNAGDKGIIMGAERNGYVLVIIDGKIYQNKDGVYCTTEKDVAVRVEDLEIILKS